MDSLLQDCTRYGTQDCTRYRTLDDGYQEKIFFFIYFSTKTSVVVTH